MFIVCSLAFVLISMETMTEEHLFDSLLDFRMQVGVYHLSLTVWPRSGFLFFCPLQEEFLNAPSRQWLDKLLVSSRSKDVAHATSGPSTVGLASSSASNGGVEDHGDIRECAKAASALGNLESDESCMFFCFQGDALFWWSSVLCCLAHLFKTGQYAWNFRV